MKKKKSPEGYRTHFVNVRLTDTEFEKFKKLLDKAKESGREDFSDSDFIRRQLLYDSHADQLIDIRFDIRKLYVELRQALIRYERMQDAQAKENLLEILREDNEKLNQIRERLEVLLNGCNGS